MAEDEPDHESWRGLYVVQSMIDISADRLEGLRTQCATSAELTQQEIRTLEGKLIKLFSRQLVAKARLKEEKLRQEMNVPSLKQWLQVVGLGPNSIVGICMKVASLEALQEKSDHEVRNILKEHCVKEEELQRLSRALHNLRRYTDILLRGENPSDTLDLYWDSWDRSSKGNPNIYGSDGKLERSSPRPDRALPRPMIPAYEDFSHSSPSFPPMPMGGQAPQYSSLPHHIPQTHNGNGCMLSAPLSPPPPHGRLSSASEDSGSDSRMLTMSSDTFTPPSTPPLSKSRVGEKVKFPTTPPPRKKHQTCLPGSYGSSTLPSTVVSTSSSVSTPMSSGNQTAVAGSSCVTSNCVTGTTGAVLLDTFPLPKSKSHESQLVAKVDNPEGTSSASVEPQVTRSVPRRVRLQTEPGPETSSAHGNGGGGGHTSSPLLSSPVRSPPYYSGSTGEGDCAESGTINKTITATLQVPKSPRTPTISRGMGHAIAHRFTKTFKVVTTCDYCDKQMFLGSGLKCKECKFKCHRDCESKVPPSCGLPVGLVYEFARSIQSDVYAPNQSPNLSRTSLSSPSHPSTVLASLVRRDRKKSHPQPSIIIPPFPGPDSSSNTSSCNSSTPSSPALVPTTTHTPLSVNKEKFHFPDLTHNHHSLPLHPEREVTLETHPLVAAHPVEALAPSTSSSASTLESGTAGSTTKVQSTALANVPVFTRSAAVTVSLNDELVETQQSNDSDRTVSASCTSGSGSVSTDSERTPVRVDSQDSQVSDGEVAGSGSAHGAGDRTWPRQNSLSLREWDIPFDELRMGEPIGTGRFGTVYRGNWHGDVAIKVLNMDQLDNEKTLEAFRLEVTTFRKTRHENLVLFMGACMKPPRLAIVTSMCKGMTLYTHIHLRKDKFSMHKTTNVAQQISQGMGYLHARGIVHKDLKSKNIFLENGKVVITDFGLFSVTKLCYGNRKGDGLSIPPGWLCYLSPEIICSLTANQKYEEEELPFTKSSDVYAFGTVWYELLCGDWPFKAQPPEAIIWQVGKGMKQSLANLQASRDVKDILMLCWSFKPSERPDFSCLLKTLEKLPKKRLARSPSHPIHLSRSAESVF
ncbi:kinase suppressor of Ras 2 [Ischnura elegans]|uniref:kinase suppressor of Ras 2 n=1 Tax=Ischnura elegans TaxID=197161 RepID=UPI001ED883EE|nr:kinase suppressor of Ras 2 [Ischnura elegans]